MKILKYKVQPTPNPNHPKTETMALFWQLIESIESNYPQTKATKLQLNRIARCYEYFDKTPGRITPPEPKPYPQNADLSDKLTTDLSNAEMMALALQRRPVPGFPNYTIDGLNRVKHERSSKFLKLSAKGYVTLYPGHKQFKPEDL